MANINIFALGGQDENGKNSHVVEFEKDIFLFNAGNQVPIQNLNGIDGIIPEFEYIKKRKQNFKGLFVTHAHDEVFAAIPWLVMEVPGIKIYGSKFTIAVIADRISKYKIQHKNFELIEIKDQVKIGKYTVKGFPVANSIPGSLAYNLQTPEGDIVFMSNAIIDDLGTFGKTDLAKIKSESNEILALMLDSRISHFKGSAADYKSVKPSIEEKIKSTKDNERIIIGAYDEEMFALEEVLELAIKYNRPVASYGRAFDNLYGLKGKFFKNNEKVNFINYKDINKTKNAIVLVTSTWSRLFQRFDRIATDNDVYLKLKPNDAIIMIAPPINGMEVEASQALDKVAKIAFNITDVDATEFYKLRPAKKDIYNIVDALKPKYFIPISALFRYLSVAADQAITAGVTRDRNVILKNGKILYLKDKKIANQKAMLKEYGDVIIDGFGVGDISFEVIREREMLGAGGLISIVQQLDRKTKKPIEDANIQIVGLATKSELATLQKEVNNVVIQKLAELEKWDFREAQNSIRKRVRKVMSKMTNKEPLVLVTIYEI